MFQMIKAKKKKWKTWEKNILKKKQWSNGFQEKNTTCRKIVIKIKNSTGGLHRD